MRPRHLTQSAFLVAFSAALAGHASRYYPFVSDDALISLRYVDRFVAGRGLTWTDGEWVEGYSNLAWILIVSIPAALGMDSLLSARIVGFLCVIVAAAALVAHYCDRESERHGAVAAAAALAFMAMSGPLAVWAIGGLEQPLVAALLALAIPPTFRLLERRTAGDALIAGLAYGGLCVTRPDGPLFAAVTGAAVIATSGRDFRLSLGLVARLWLFPVLLVAAQLAFRITYYGEMLPNTAHVKLGASPERAVEGARFLFDGLLSLGPFVLLAAVGAVLSTRTRRTGFLVALAGAWAAYLVVIGGDYNGRRHFLPLIVIFAFALAEGVVQLWQDRDALRERRLLALAVLAVTGTIFAAFQVMDPHGRQVLAATWPHSGMRLGRVLKEAFADERPLLAVTAAGCLPYSSGLPSLDMLGLNDRHIAHTASIEGAHATLGHDKGDGAYVLRRRPDLIVYHHGLPDPAFRSGIEMAQTAEFHAEYIRVPVITPPPEAFLGWVWMRKWSEKVGALREGDTLRIPAYLFDGVSPAHLTNTGKLVVFLPPGERAAFDLGAVRQTGARARVVPPSPVSAFIGPDGRVVLQSASDEPAVLETIVVEGVDR